MQKDKEGRTIQTTEHLTILEPQNPPIVDFISLRTFIDGSRFGKN